MSEPKSNVGTAAQNKEFSFTCENTTYNARASIIMPYRKNILLGFFVCFVILGASATK